MKKLSISTYLTIIIIACAGFVTEANAQFQSDRQIIRNYQNEYQAILSEVKSLESVNDARMLTDRINRLNNDYLEHRELINRFIHPEDFDGQVFSLRELTDASRRKLQQLEDRDNEIERLNAQISDMSDRLDRFSLRSDSLQQALERMTRDRNANAAMVRNLRGELAKYDNFILGLVDSLFVAYDNLDLSSLSPSERREFALRADKDNVVGHIGSVIENNIVFIDTHSQLSSTDLLNLKSTHAEFKDSWKNLGSRLSDLYQNERDSQLKVAEVNENITIWGDRLDQALWRSLSATIEVRGISLAGFSSPSTFYNALVSYIDESIQYLNEHGGSEEELLKYVQF